MEPLAALPTATKVGMVLARRWLRRAGVLIRPDDLPFVQHAQFVSRFIREASGERLPLRTQEVIPWGIEVGRFRFRERRPEELRRWIYVGQLESHKGVDTVIEAVEQLRAAGEAVELTICGHDTTPCARDLKERVARAGQGDAIRFAGAVARERLPEEVYDRGGLLVFPSRWNEPFSITLLEAFAAGLPVLTTLTGGTGEIVRHGENATVFSAGRADHLAAQWRTLAREPEEGVIRARRARALVEQHLDVERMVDRVEAHLIEVAEGRGSEAAERFVPRPHAWEPAGAVARAPRLDPDARGGAWLATLFDDLAADAGGAEVPAVSRLLNGRHGRHLEGLVLDVCGTSARAEIRGRVVRVDVTPESRPALCAGLDALPFGDALFDAVLGIGVLERCPRPWVAVREFGRVLRPGGHLLVSASFLQPGEPGSGDYFRFTADGLAALVREAGLHVLESGPDHPPRPPLASLLWEVLRRHPRHGYLASDARVREWFDDLARGARRLELPALEGAVCVVARREA
jgi:SAM-dependent methyltransferase